jgi:glycosyltransferase involved in cell wall biosynthesis
MRVCLVLDHYPPYVGGLEEGFKNLALGLAAKGHKVDIVTTAHQGMPRYEHEGNITVYRVGTSSRMLFTFSSIPTVLRVARRADIIHGSTYNGAFPAWFAAKLLRKPCALTVHEIRGPAWHNLFGMGRIKASILQLLERMVIALPFDQYIAHSNFTKNALQLYGKTGDKLNTIYCTIDYRLFDSKRHSGTAIRKQLQVADKFVYLYFGRPGVLKGVEYLIQAVPEISKRLPNSKLVLLLARDPADRYKLMNQLIDELGVRNSVIVHDSVPRERLPDWLMAADCVVVPSLSEGFGLSAAEACAMGRPVVATDAGSLPEVVSGRSVVVKSGSSEAIAEGVIAVAQKRVPDLGKHIFTLEDKINGHLRVYNKLLSSQTRPAK